MAGVREPELVEEASAPFRTRWGWKGGATAGLLAAVSMGVLVTATNAETLREAIAGLYGMEGSFVAGWVAHLVHGTLFGVLFAAVMADPGLYRVTEWRWKSVLAGAVFGIVLAVAGAGIIMPMWLGLVGFPQPPSLPNVTAPIILWHLVYGFVLGLVYPSVEDV